MLISSCLAGYKCRYNGKSESNKEMIELVKSGKGIPICAEQLAGLTTPRSPLEIINASGEDVLEGKAKVLSKEGDDYTEKMIEGAIRTLELCRLYNIKKAYLKANSPSCGVGKIYDGTFKGNMISGNGILSALLKKNGIDIIEVK